MIVQSAEAKLQFYLAELMPPNPAPKPIFLDEVNFKHPFVRRFAKLKYKVMKLHVGCACMRHGADKNASQRGFTSATIILSAQREINTSLGTGTTRGFDVNYSVKVSFSSKFASAGVNHRKKNQH